MSEWCSFFLYRDFPINHVGINDNNNNNCNGTDGKQCKNHWYLQIFGSQWSFSNPLSFFCFVFVDMVLHQISSVG